MKSLREIVEEAASKVDTYKYPDIGEETKRIDEILKALGEGSISGDTVDYIIIGEDDVCINTSYTVRGCDGSSRYQIPVSIIDSPDPIKAARIWSINKKIRNSEEIKRSAERSVILHDEELVKLKSQLEDLINE